MAAWIQLTRMNPPISTVNDVRPMVLLEVRLSTILPNIRGGPIVKIFNAITDVIVVAKSGLC
ncbi:hypothetical protein PS723_01377 [Pseudomonas fluorescens]|uniref:Uncharacterized protein n=1 Tax=Pseudomonas fluorescens TaxID=294 RepID=A0A5E7B1A6_PSEFL|nr:hypothetical protein PS723_01377 [Pseudomonas fluorescens]